MRIGLIGAGSMAAALAEGWGEPLLVADPDAARASALAAQCRGEALASNAEVAGRADLVVLCHKPAQLDEVAGEIAGAAGVVASILWGVRTGDLERAYPGAAVYRFIPNIPVAVGRGLVGYARGAGAGADAEAERAVLELFGRLGAVLPLDEDAMDRAGALLACGPAFYALVAEALADAGERRGLDAAQSRELAIETMAGAAEVLRRRDLDTVALRRRVASPGGVTERGLEALERGGVRDAFDDAVATVLGER